ADGSWFSTANIPRLKVEYQLTRDIFFRYVGQYFAQVRDTLRDPRTGDQLIVNGNPQGAAQTRSSATTFCSPTGRRPGRSSSLGTARHSASPIRSASAACHARETDSS